MKKLIVKTMAICISVCFIASQMPVLADNITHETLSGAISTVYSYDNNFGLTGTYHSVTNNADGSITNFFSNGSVSGHGALNSEGQIDNTTFIPQSVSYFNSNGILEKSVNLVTNTVQVYDFTGQLQSSYSMIEKSDFTGTTTQQWAEFLADPNNWYYYYATVDHNSDGSYSVQYSGELYDAATNAVVTIQDYASANDISVADAVSSLQSKWPTLTNLSSSSPYPFITSEDQYDSTGRMTKVVTYGLKADDSASLAESETDYSYIGTTINQDITYQYNTDSSGNPIAPTSYSNGIPQNNVTITQVELYTGNNKTAVVSIKPGTASGTTDWSDYDTSSNSDYYVSQEYIYSGVKLTEMDAFDSTNDHHCTQITYYDPYGRETTVVDAITDPANTSGSARVLEQYFYNDQTNPVTFSSYDGQYSDTVVGGGLEYSIAYTYGDTGTDYVSSDQTFYENGDQTKPAFAIHLDNPTATAELTESTNNGETTVSFADSVVAGTLTLGGSAIKSATPPVPNGTLSLEIDNCSNFLAVINEVQAAINTVSSGSAEATALNSVITALIKQWTTSGGTNVALSNGVWSWSFPTNSSVTTPAAGTTNINLGVISLPAVPTAASPNVEYIGKAPVVNSANQVTGNNSAGIFDLSNFNTLYKWVQSLAGTAAALTQGATPTYNNPIAANLICNYWAVDSSGNIWAFADTVTNPGNGGATIIQ